MEYWNGRPEVTPINAAALPGPGRCTPCMASASRVAISNASARTPLPPLAGASQGIRPEHKHLLPHTTACTSLIHNPLVCRVRAFEMGKCRLTRRQRSYVQRFEDAELKYFYSVMTKSSVMQLIAGRFAYQLEIPVEFLQAYSSEFTADCTVECKSRDRESTKQWPLGITVRYCRSLDKVRALAYGVDGWKQFFTDNGVGLGDLVVFQLTDYSRFRAYILPRIPARRPNAT